MANATKVTAQSLARGIVDFYNLSKPAYIRREAKSNELPLYFLRISITKESTDSVVIISLHAQESKRTNEVGGMEFQESVKLPTEELDNFIVAYKIAQVDDDAKRENRFIDYYLDNFLGTYGAYNLNK